MRVRPHLWVLLGLLLLCTRKEWPSDQKAHTKSGGAPWGRQFGETIPVRLTASMSHDVGLWARGNGLTRSEAIRRLVQLGLKARRG
jgi:hypothetical protein